MITKDWYKSRTLRLAILQGLAGVVTALMVTDPTLQGVGMLAIIKSIIDVSIRFTSKGEIIK